MLKAREHGEKHYLKVDTATTAVAESGVWGAARGSRGAQLVVLLCAN